jgi:hypothetical protein
MTRNWAACWAGVLCLLTGQAAAVLKVRAPLSSTPMRRLGARRCVAPQLTASWPPPQPPPRPPQPLAHPRPRPQVPSCTPSIADYISSAPDLSVWVSSVSDKDGVVYVKDCPGDMPNSFTVFVGTTQAVAGLLTCEYTRRSVRVEGRGVGEAGASAAPRRRPPHSS